MRSRGWTEPGTSSSAGTGSGFAVITRACTGAAVEWTAGSSPQAVIGMSPAKIAVNAKGLVCMVVPPSGIDSL